METRKPPNIKKNNIKITEMRLPAEILGTTVEIARQMEVATRFTSNSTAKNKKNLLISDEKPISQYASVPSNIGGMALMGSNSNKDLLKKYTLVL